MRHAGRDDVEIVSRFGVVRRQKLAESTMHMRDPGSEKRAQEKELYRL